MDKVKKTRMLMENFNKFLKESETTPEIVDDPSIKNRKYDEFEMEFEEFEINGKFIEYARILVYYDSYSNEGVTIYSIWMELENGKWQNITDLIDEEHTEYAYESIENNLKEFDFPYDGYDLYLQREIDQMDDLRS